MRAVPLSGPLALRRVGVIVTTFAFAFAPVVLAAGGARASDVPDHLTVTPNEAALGTSVSVSGACPESVAAPFVVATVRLEQLDRSVDLPVVDGAFTGSVEVVPGAGGTSPEPGTTVTARARCRTEVGVVAMAGDEQLLRLVAAPATTAPSTRPASGAKTVSRAEKRAERRAASRSTAGATPPPTAVAATPAADRPIDPTVPLVALAVAALGSIATLTMSARRSRRERER